MDARLTAGPAGSAPVMAAASSSPRDEDPRVGREAGGRRGRADVRRATAAAGGRGELVGLAVAAHQGVQRGVQGHREVSGHLRAEPAGRRRKVACVAVAASGADRHHVQ